MNKAAQDIVGVHDVASRRVLIERITWKDAAGPSYDILDARTLECLTMDESFDHYPTDEQIRSVLELLRPDAGTTGAAPTDSRFPDEVRCRRFNLAADFHPMTNEDTLPCLAVAGIQIYGYLDHSVGGVRVSVDLDTVDPALLRPDGTVPLLVQCGESTLFADTEQPADTSRPGTSAASGAVRRRRFWRW